MGWVVKNIICVYMMSCVCVLIVISRLVVMITISVVPDTIDYEPY